MRGRAIGVAVAFGLLVAGSPVANAATETKAVDACALITPVDIEDVLAIPGAAVNEQVSASAPGFCAYNLPGTPVAGLLTVGLAKFTKVAKQDFATNSAQEGARKIPGVKKGFYIVATTGGASSAVTRPEGSEADVVLGKRFLVIQVLTVEIHEDAFLELINLAIERV